MKFQLVLQFVASEIGQYDDLVALEEMISKGLSANAQVDGHDFGSGEFNIFVLTDTPMQTLEAARRLIKITFRAGYRERNEEGYTPLWPEGLKEFRVA